MPPPEAQCLTVHGGNLYLSRELCDAYLPCTQTVALLAREGRLLIVPLLRESAGGLLLKLRNARGDRVVHAQEFFRQHGFDEDAGQQRLAVRWCPESAALVLSEPLRG